VWKYVCLGFGELYLWGQKLEVLEFECNTSTTSDISLHKGRRGLLSYCSIDSMDCGGGIVKETFAEDLGSIPLRRVVSTLSIARDRDMR